MFSEPMMHRFRSIIIFLTFRCRVGCPTCNVNAQPDAPAGLSTEWIEHFLTPISPARSPGYVIWTGGEPFLAFETLEAGIRIAGNRGYHSEILTSGDESALQPDRLDRLISAGPFHLRISLDAEHQQIIPMDRIHALVDSALKHNVPVAFTLRAIPDAHPDPAEIRDTLIRHHPALRHTGVPLSRLFHVIPTISSPVDVTPLTESPKSTRSRIHSIVDDPGSCRLGFQDIVIGPDGRLYPCCGLFGLGIDEMIHAGNALTSVPGTPDELTDARP
ncbi:radical SAM protein, partial [bacterium]|nr:radical SAM protein [candidate division CSSED10-310 bacterium]